MSAEFLLQWHIEIIDEDKEVVVWVLGTIKTFLVLFEFTLSVVLDLLRRGRSREYHLSTLPAILAVTRDLGQELRDELLDGTSLTRARVSNDQHGELMAHYDIHEELLLY